MNTTKELKNKFFKFFENREHKIFPSSSLIPENDDSLLFTSAGMNQFKDYFLGKKKDIKRAASCQKCLRTGDLEKVGMTNYHHTFFEMLGNFSFGDYFKKEAIIWAWEFLTKEIKLNKERIWISVYKEDEEAYIVWTKLVKKSKILQLGTKDNFWPTNAPEKGPNGPCGPCSEIFFNLNDNNNPKLTEIWNLVFTQFNRIDKNKLIPLPAKNIDTGMGLERLSAMVQGKASNYDIDILSFIKNSIKSQIKNINDLSTNIITDHIRAIVFSIFDGVYPSNKGRGYVIRKLIRRALYNYYLYGIKQPLLHKLSHLVIDKYNLHNKENIISEIIFNEELKFLQVLNRGKKLLLKYINKNKIINGALAFRLYDTYGIPIDFTKLIASKNNCLVDEKQFLELLKKQKEKSKQNNKFKNSIF
ncbi:alanine--tRNA ligase [Candidatus Pacearchaeota archaeon]|nr:MAG: alanine--tRNA ligase [Candidatus Pacearchaeota archaeon]